jgi:hypothetical protein
MEQLYHPDNYKKKYCKSFYERKVCKFGDYCALAHTEEELQIKLLHKMEKDKIFFLNHFKSEFCPFSKIEHDKFKCFYAHNWQDYKRPFFNSMKPILCENWLRTEKLDFYEEGCQLGFDCLFCHGWKELDYHVVNFKQKKCQTKNCKRNQICCYYHTKNEKKLYQLNILESLISTKVSILTSPKSKELNFINKETNPQNQESHNTQNISKKDSATSINTCDVSIFKEDDLNEEKKHKNSEKTISDLFANNLTISHNENDSNNFSLNGLVGQKHDQNIIENLFYTNNELFYRFI